MTNSANRASRLAENRSVVIVAPEIEIPDWTALSLGGRRATLSASPQLFRRQPRAFGHSLEFGPADLRAADSGPEAAVCARHHVFSSDDLGIADQSICDGLRVLDDVGCVADHARDQHSSDAQLHFFPNAPLMLVARVGGFNGNCIRVHFQN